MHLAELLLESMSLLLVCMLWPTTHSKEARLQVFEAAGESHEKPTQERLFIWYAMYHTYHEDNNQHIFITRHAVAQRFRVFCCEVSFLRLGLVFKTAYVCTSLFGPVKHKLLAPFLTDSTPTDNEEEYNALTHETPKFK